ncbi:MULTISPECIES: ABC transporter permease [unclassified Nocardioides]|uniref:ABC transporter permease n=1 Tax=unclassified Nocardioides TaxID=2615069 RepID=UPI000056FD28|nr:MULTISPECIES: ABC transporter permease [unclassified Nocardioides]ABL80333.1 monosaccharide ABC transporter membrane protein, CUT2 family [Nocardioides sp. JS614]
MNTKQRQNAGSIVEFLSKFALVVVLIALALTFSLMRPESFGTVDNFKAIADNYAVVLLLACAATLPLIVGQFDLSFGSLFAFVQMIVVGNVINKGWSVPSALLVAFMAATLVGLINGVAVAKFKISSFIATLASGSILTGLSLAYSKGESVFGAAPDSLTRIARSEFLGMRLPIWYSVVVVIVLAIVLHRTPVGRRMYATGSNERAALLTGIPARRYVMATFVLAAWLAAAAGVVIGSRIGAATPDSGSTMLIPAFAGAFLGSTAFTGGRFNIPGTVVAVLVVGITVTGLQQLGAALWVEPVFNGIVLFAAVGLSAWMSRLRAARARKARLRELSEHRQAEEGRAEGYDEITV